MHDVTPLVVFISVLVLVVGGSLGLSRWQAKKARANLSVLAHDLGLRLEEKPPVLGVFPQVPTVSGEYGHRELCFYTFTTGSGKSRQTWQAARLACTNPHGLILQLGAANILTAIGVMLGMQDVEVGDPEFDRRFVVKTSDAGYVRAALLPEIRSELLRLWTPKAFGANIKLESGGILYAELGSFSDPEVTKRMRAMLDPLLALAAVAEVYRK